MSSYISITRNGLKEGSDNEIIHLEAENFKATIVMNMRAAQGHIMVVLFYNGQKVGLTELTGVSMPSKIHTQWQNSGERERWELSCALK